MSRHGLLRTGTYEKDLGDFSKPLVIPHSPHVYFAHVCIAGQSISTRWNGSCLRYMLTIYFQDTKRGISLSKTLSGAHKHRHSSGIHDDLKRPLRLKKQQRFQDSNLQYCHIVHEIRFSPWFPEEIVFDINYEANRTG